MEESLLQSNPLKTASFILLLRSFSPVKGLHPSSICTPRTSDRFQTPVQLPVPFQRNSHLRRMHDEDSQPKPILMQLSPCAAASLPSHHCSSSTQRAVSETSQEK